jgi:hypothetical protein
MDVILMTVLPGLGAFAPFAVLAWWVVRTQAKQLETKEAHLRKISERVVEALMNSLSRVSRAD